MIAALFPPFAVGNQLPLISLDDGYLSLAPSLAACLSSFALDFAARTKVGGTHLNFFIANQIPVLPPDVSRAPSPWAPQRPLSSWTKDRVLELAYSAVDMGGFAIDLDYPDKPFAWDIARRFEIRCELEAGFFHLYGVSRDDVDYVMETFPIVKRKDEDAHGTYRTKDRILEIYDAMQRAVDTGVPYQTSLDPPPGDPRASHKSARSTAASAS